MTARTKNVLCIVGVVGEADSKAISLYLLPEYDKDIKPAQVVQLTQVLYLQTFLSHVFPELALVV